MKKILIFSFLITVQVSYAQDCNTRAANKAAESVRFQDGYAKSYEDPKANISTAKLKPHLAAAENWVKGLLKGFTGAKLAYSNEFDFDYSTNDPFYKATGIKGYYYVQMRFFAYYCEDNGISTEGESGSSIMVYFNDFFRSYGLHGLCEGKGLFTINGKPAFLIYEKNRTEGKIDYYDRIWQGTVADTVYASKDEFIIIRNSDNQLFLPITRTEYLQQLFKDVEAYKNRQIASAKEAYTPAAEAANKAQFEESLKRIDNSKTSTKEQMAPYRKRFIETWETEKQKFEKQIAKTEKETNEANEVLKEYLKKPQDWLNRTFKSFFNNYTYSGKAIRAYLEELDKIRYSKEEETRKYVVSLNPAYFNKSLGADVPQVILVQLAKAGYSHMKKVASLVHKPGALAPLEAIFSSGTKPISPASVSSTSSYTLSFLPKLNKLTPLVVPADMKPSAVAALPVNNTPVHPFNFDLPVLSPKLKQLPPQPFTAEAYKNYVAELQAKIAGAIKPAIKKKADDYIKNKKPATAAGISNSALAAWLQKAPQASLYLYSQAVAANVTDGLCANNFSAFLIMSGLPEKAIPVLEYWNKQQPRKSTILSNLGSAYYRLGDVVSAMKYLQQCVQQDSLNATANKLLCMMYLKKGNAAKSEEHGIRCIITTHDQQVISILQLLNKKIKPGEVMSRFPPLPEKEFPMLERVKLPRMPSSLDDMDQFSIELDAMKASLKKTIAAITAKMPTQGDDVQQQLLMTGPGKSLPPFILKAQYIIMDGLQVYIGEHLMEYDVFRHHLKKLNKPYNTNIKAIHAEYNSKINKLEGGEAGDEDKIAALELAKCRALKDETERYLAGFSRLLNQYAARLECVSRKYSRDCANWAPYWAPESSLSFPAIQKRYLEDVLNILGEYTVFTKMNCDQAENLAAKEGELQQWEEEYCANLKGKIGIGPAKLFWTCKSWGIEGGEGIVGGFEANYADNGSFEDVSFELGFGADWDIGNKHIAQISAGASVKEFVKIGPDKLTGDWGVTDAGVKGEIALEGEIGNVSGEVKVIEVTAGYISGVNAEGIAAPVLDLK